MFITTDRTGAFQIKGKEVIYLGDCVSIPMIELSHDLSSAVFVIQSFVPNNLVMSIADGADIEICYQECGPRNVREYYDRLLLLTNCKVIRRWLSGILTTDTVEHTKINVKLEGQIAEASLLLWGETR